MLSDLYTTVHFGWFLDGAPWAEGTSLGNVRVGPKGMLELLQKRLGMTQQPTPEVLRIAGYLKALEEVDPTWCQQSLSVDPWGTAKYMLGLRDQLVVAGWQPPEDGDLSTRMGALAAVEQAPSDGLVAVRTGEADQLRQMIDVLAQESSENVLGRLNIHQVVIEDKRDHLPGLWPELFVGLSDLNVEVRDAGDATSGSKPGVTVLWCNDEFHAAQATARYLEQAPDSHDQKGSVSQVLATRPTLLLDHELSLRGLPELAVAGGDIPPPYQRLLAAVLRLRLRPPSDSSSGYPADPHQLYGLLGARLHGKGGGLFRPSLARKLRRDLEDKPSPLSDKFQATLAETIALGQADDGNRVAAQEAAELRALLAAAAEGPQPGLLDQATQSAQWLRNQVARMPKPLDGTGREVRRQIMQQVDGFLDVLRSLPNSAVSAELILNLAQAAAPSALPGTRAGEAAPWTVLTSPAQGVPRIGGTLVWWGGLDNSERIINPWTQEERKVLQAQQARLITAEQLAMLETRAGQRGLGGAAHIVAFVPRQVGGAAGELHPLLRLFGDAKDDSPKDAVAEDAVRFPERTSSLPPQMHLAMGGAAAGDTAGRKDPLKTLDKALRKLHVEEKIRKAFVGDLTRSVIGGPTQVLAPDVGAALGPKNLSVSSAEAMLGCPICWVLDRRMCVRPAGVSLLPRGNQLIGSLVHEVVENLIPKPDSDGPGPRPEFQDVTEEQIGEMFEHTVRSLAAELLQPGQVGRRQAVRKRTISTVKTLQGALASLGALDPRAEAKKVDKVFFPTFRTDGEQKPLEFLGYIDVLSDFPTRGRPLILDLKWTNKPDRFVNRYKEGRAVQLAAYARLTLEESERKQALWPVTTGYFLLKEERLFPSSDVLVGNDTEQELASREVWEQFANAVGLQLDLFKLGLVTSIPGQAWLARAPLETGDPLKAWTKAFNEANDGAHRDDHRFYSPIDRETCKYSPTRFFCGSGEGLS